MRALSPAQNKIERRQFFQNVNRNREGHFHWKTLFAWVCLWLCTTCDIR